jgi:arylesterase/paraoxonase
VLFRYSAFDVGGGAVGVGDGDLRAGHRGADGHRAFQHGRRDVVAVGPEAFYATNDAGTVNGTAGRGAETFLQLPWASVVFFDGTKASVVATGLKYANGITTSADRRTVFVSESTGRRLFSFARDEASGALTELAHQTLESALDNFSVDDSGALWLGAHPKLLAFLGHARDAKNTSPSEVLRVTWNASAKTFDVTQVLLDDGTTLSGSSVAVPLGAGRFLVGSVFEPHLLDCR